MAGYGAFQFASPQQFGDWAQYAGMDRTTGEMQGIQPPQQGVAPPESISQMVDQRLGNIQKVASAMGASFDQAGQGNMMQAFGTMRGARSPTMQNTTVKPAIDHSYDYTYGLEN